MEAGKLNRRVTIKELTDGQDEIGQPVQTWTDVATVWAHIRHLSGVETIKADADTSSVKSAIRIRRRAGVDAGMRVYLGAVVYEIKAVIPDEETRVHLDLQCEVVNGG
jgi:SPP1 family predicted phage head-tail adaptor